jgi:hypothetical protein
VRPLQGPGVVPNVSVPGIPPTNFAEPSGSPFASAGGPVSMQMAGVPPEKRQRVDGGPDGAGADVEPVTGVLERRAVEEKMRQVCAKLDPAPATAAAAVKLDMPASTAADGSGGSCLSRSLSAAVAAAIDICCGGSRHGGGTPRSRARLGGPVASARCTRLSHCGHCAAFRTACCELCGAEG